MMGAWDKDREADKLAAAERAEAKAGVRLYFAARWTTVDRREPVTTPDWADWDERENA
jgi:hypothetical protein